MRNKEATRSWEKAMGKRSSRLNSHGRRKAAAIEIKSVSARTSTYVEVEDVSVTVVHDEMDSDQRSAGLVVSRWQASWNSNGVCWGSDRIGGTSDVFRKCSPPKTRCRSNGKTPACIANVLELEKALVQAGRCRETLPVHPAFPELWAGFSPAIEEDVELGGPVCEMFRRRWDWPNDVLKNIYRRQHAGGLILLPMQWVVHCLSDATSVFAKLDGFPRRQTIRLSASLDELAGEEFGIHWNFQPIKTAPEFSNLRSTCKALA